MNNRNKLVLLFAFTLSVGLSSQAQDDLGTIFSDSDAPEIDQVIKWNTGALVFSDLSIQYEQMIMDFVSLEAGIGKTLGYRGWQFNNEFEEEFTAANEALVGGFSYNLAARVYFIQEGPVGYFISPMYMYRKREFETQVIQHHYYIINYGFQLELSKHILLEYYAGAGYRSSSTDGLGIAMYPDRDLKEGALSGSATLKIGYAF